MDLSLLSFNLQTLHTLYLTTAPHLPPPILPVVAHALPTPIILAQLHNYVFSYYGCYSFKHRWDVAWGVRMCQCWRTNGWMIDPSSPSQKFKCLMVKAPLWWFFCKDTMMLSFGFAGEYNDVIFWIHRWIRGGLSLFVIFELAVVSHKALGAYRLTKKLHYMPMI
jgi:hypothetical protein